MSTEERLNLEREDRHHEGALARLAGRLKFTGCRRCGSDFGMFSATREQIAEFLPGAIKRFAPWYREIGNNWVLYYPCWACNWKGAHGVPGNLEPISVTDVQAWLNRNPMAPNYAALTAGPEPVLASQDSHESAGL